MLNSRDKFRQAPPPELPQVKYSEVEGYFGVLITLYHIRKLLSSHGIRPAHEMLEEKLRQGYNSLTIYDVHTVDSCMVVNVFLYWRLDFISETVVLRETKQCYMENISHVFLLGYKFSLPVAIAGFNQALFLLTHWSNVLFSDLINFARNFNLDRNCYLFLNTFFF